MNIRKILFTTTLSCWYLLVCHSLLYAQQDTLTQISTIDALLNGLYDGEITMKQLVQDGDTGIGTFNALDGEMIMLDSTIYQVTADGTVRIPDEKTTTPFAAVTFFDSDLSQKFESGTSYNTFETRLDSLLPTLNLFYAIKLKGVFKQVKTRSVPKQKKPYPPLNEVAKNQPTFDFKNVEGTMVGFRCPTYVKGINVPGYHLHFLTKDKSAGGHVLDFVIENAIAQIDYTSQFLLTLPSERAFFNTDLTVDKSKELDAVEK